MSWEYRIEIKDETIKRYALELLEKSHLFHWPLSPSRTGEIWLTTSLNNKSIDARIFQESYGFLIEITCLPEVLANELNAWAAKLNMLGASLIIDNDTEEFCQTFIRPKSF